MLSATAKQSSWKVRHIGKNRSVSITVSIPKRVPIMPWVKIPAATITFQGEATVHNVEEIPQEIQKTLLWGLELDQKGVSRLCIIKVNPRGDFLTYGVGVSLLTMRYPEKSRGRILV